LDDPRAWLLDAGGPVIRYRTARDLMDRAGTALDGLRRDLLRSPLVRRWLARLGPGTAFAQLPREWLPSRPGY
jgi:hypothetical protein